MLMRVDGLPVAPLAAAADFHARVLPGVLVWLERDAGAGEAEPERGAEPEPLTLLFPPADHQHRGWRAAVVASLARGAAPRRVNAVVGDDANDATAIAETLAWLARAPGVTGQVLVCEGVIPKHVD